MTTLTSGVQFPEFLNQPSLETPVLDHGEFFRMAFGRMSVSTILTVLLLTMSTGLLLKLVYILLLFGWSFFGNIIMFFMDCMFSSLASYDEC